ncbi:MAG: DsrE/DsrF/DrsH-like family protein [Euryarchaeota archaeon]|jgi:predicted peroxiredoxin|nr:DsrE/DsrF/DrsH-like family protein [Euryarchaeota archaeon]
MAKVAIVVNSTEPRCVYPPYVLGTSALAIGDEVMLFFTPGGSPILKAGELEKLKSKGLPDMEDLVKKFNALGGKLYLCELALEAKDLKREELRKDMEIIGATEFMSKASECTVTFSF